MKLLTLALLAAVAGLYGCSDTDTVSSGEDKTAPTANAARTTDELAQTLKQDAAEAAKDLSASLDSAAEQLGAAAESSAEAGSQALQQTQSDAAAAAADTVQAASEQVADTASGLESGTQETVAAAGLEAAALSKDADAEAMATGKAVYAKHCMACHAAGVAGAPKTSDVAVWEPRIAQGMETLYDHAINGFKGSKGYMPPKGGFAALKDDEVKAAVTYMVSASQ